MIAAVAGVPYCLLLLYDLLVNVALGLFINKFNNFLSLAQGIMLCRVASMLMMAL